MGGRVTEGMDSCVTLQPTAPGKKHNPQQKASDLRNCSSLAFVGKLQLTALREVAAPGNSLESCEQTEICSPGTREEPRCQSSLHPLPPCSQEQTSVCVCVQPGGSECWCGETMEVCRSMSVGACGGDQVCGVWGEQGISKWIEQMDGPPYCCPSSHGLVP